MYGMIEQSYGEDAVPLTDTWKHVCMRGHTHATVDCRNKNTYCNSYSAYKN